MANGPSQPALAVPRVTWLERGLFALLCGLYLFLCAFYARNIGSEIVDDAFIIFRYADNFARGEGLVYNPGEPVEGYTSFSWTLLLGLLATPGQSLVGLAQTLGVLSGLLSLSLAWWLGRALLSEKRWLPLLVVALLATNRSVSVWAIEGLETKFFGLSLLATLAAWVRLGAGGSWRGVPVVGLLAAWMALTRPEGFLLALWLVLAGAWWARREGELRSLGINAAVFCLVVFAHLGWRLALYGDWVPNTFHAKVSGLEFARGGAYLAAMAQANAFWALGPLVLMGGVLGLTGRREGSERERAFILFSLLSLGSLALYWASIGGDYFEFRFYEPLMPLSFLLAAHGLSGLHARLVSRSAMAARVVGLGVALLLLGANFRSVTRPFPGTSHVTSPERSKKFTQLFAKVGRWLATNIPPQESLAIRPAGVIAYLSRLRCVDELGLNDREVLANATYVPGPAGHQWAVGDDYLLSRGVHYRIAHPTIYQSPAPPGQGWVSAEIEPGLFFVFRRLDPGASLEDRVYRLDELEAPLEGWDPVHREGE